MHHSHRGLAVEEPEQRGHKDVGCGRWSPTSRKALTFRPLGEKEIMLKTNSIKIG